MVGSPKIACAALSGLIALGLPSLTAAATITANCTGMLNLDNYSFDTDLPTQEVEGIGTAAFTMTEAEIVLTGTFGEYRFDLRNGTLYQNGADTGVYCTYRGLPQ